MSRSEPLLFLDVSLGDIWKPLTQRHSPYVQASDHIFEPYEVLPRGENSAGDLDRKVTGVELGRHSGAQTDSSSHSSSPPPSAASTAAGPGAC